MTTTTTTVSDQDRDRRLRRAAILRFGLAGVAVLGIGAALTSATWTDDAWFAGSAAAVERVELQASLDGATWYDADSSDGGVAVKIPDTELAGLNQGADEQLTLHLKNDSSVPLTLGSGVLTTDGAQATSIFGGDAPATAEITDPGTDVLGSGETTTVTLRVTTPDDWPATYQGKSGTLTVQFTGES